MKYSFVMPTWNKQSWISEAIQSIIDQTITDWELLIIDDGSTDHTEKIVNHYIKKDPRIKYFKKEHTGIADTRNFGNKLAQGEWICVQDSDDKSYPFRLEEFDKYIVKHPEVEIFHSGINLVSINADRISECWPGKELTAEALRNGDQTVIHASVIARKEVYDKVPYRTEQVINDDFPWVVDCWNEGFIFGFIQEPTTQYRVLQSGVSAKNFKKIRKELPKWEKLVKDIT